MFVKYVKIPKYEFDYISLCFVGPPDCTLDFNTKRSVDGSVDVTELHFVTPCVCLSLDISHD